MSGGCRWDHKQSDFIASPEAIISVFFAELMTLVHGWKQRLQADPAALPELEREIQIHFVRGADLAVVGLVSEFMQLAAFSYVMDRVRRDSLTPRAPGRWREVKVRLLGGLIMWVTSLYCQARGRADKEALESTPGLNLGLAAMGFAKGC